MFTLLCSGLLIVGNASAIDVSGNSFYNYARPGHVRLTQWHDRVYDDGGQYQITIARDHSRVWVQLDADDNPHDKGIELRCQRQR